MRPDLEITRNRSGNKKRLEIELEMGWNWKLWTGEVTDGVKPLSEQNWAREDVNCVYRYKRIPVIQINFFAFVV